MELFNASGTARSLRASSLFAIGPSKPGPALRRGFLLAVPVGLALAECLRGDPLVIAICLTLGTALGIVIAGAAFVL